MRPFSALPLLLPLIAALPAPQATTTTTTTNYDPTTYYDPNVPTTDNIVSPSTTYLARRSEVTSFVIHSASPTPFPTYINATNLNTTNLNATHLNATHLTATHLNATLPDQLSHLKGRDAQLTEDDADVGFLLTVEEDAANKAKNIIERSPAIELNSTEESPVLRVRDQKEDAEEAVEDAKHKPSTAAPVLIKVVTLPCCDANSTTKSACTACLPKHEVGSAAVSTAGEVAHMINSVIVDLFGKFSRRKMKRGDVAEGWGELIHEAWGGEDDHGKGPRWDDTKCGFICTFGKTKRWEREGLSKEAPVSPPAPHPLAARSGHTIFDLLPKPSDRDHAVQDASYARNILFFAQAYLVKLEHDAATAQKNADQQLSLGRPAVKEQEYAKEKQKAVDGHKVRIQDLAEKAEKASSVGDKAWLGGSAGNNDEGFLGK